MIDDKIIGIIAGTGLENFMKGADERVEKNDYGEALLLVGDNLAFVNRHGRDKDTPPHQINYQANLLALQELGATAILGIYSVGSLKKEISPGSLLVPDDYINFHPVTFFNARQHVTPQIDADLRSKIIATAKKLEIRIIPRGVYFQSPGPRLETRAEITMLRKFADVIGMTLASEATLARELGIPYAAICQADNYAHGLGDTVPDFEKIMAEASDKRQDLFRLLSEVIKAI